MSEKSLTISVAITSTTYDLPTQPESMVALKNISANAIWFSHKTGTAAVIEGPECEPILAGETVYLMWRKTITAIAATGVSKLVATNSLGRS